MGIEEPPPDRDLRLHLERMSEHKRSNIEELRADPTLKFYGKVESSWIEKYFANRKPGFFDGTEGQYRMIAWHILVARTLFIDDPKRKSIQKVDVENALKKIEAHRDSPLGRLNIFKKRNILYIAGSARIEEYKEEFSDPEDREEIDLCKKEYGEYRFGIQPVANALDEFARKYGYQFHLERPRSLQSEREQDIQTKNILTRIRDIEPPATFVFDSDGLRDYFCFHRDCTGGGISFNELVDAFVERAKKFGSRMMPSIRDGTYTMVDIVTFLQCRGEFAANFNKELRQKTEGKCPLPIVLARAEYGQPAVGFTGMDFFCDVLGFKRRPPEGDEGFPPVRGEPVRLQSEGVEVKNLITLDESRVGFNNFVLFVPDMYSSPGKQSYLPITRRDREKPRRIKEENKEKGAV